MRTGSIGNRDVETMIKTLLEPKKSILAKLREILLAQNFLEEPGYDAINVESYISYSILGKTRFIFKFKWELAVFFVLQNNEERNILGLNFPAINERQFEQNSEDQTLWLKLNAQSDEQLIVDLAKSYSQSK